MSSLNPTKPNLSNKPSTILQRFGLSPVKVWTTNKVVPLENPDPSLIYGVELEIENCHADMAVPGLTETQDGSLRNNGLEFVGAPMTYSHLAYVLNAFFCKNRELSEVNYSERCSVHIHTNAQDLSFEQLATLLMVYQVCEGVLFNYIGDDRDKNIFCVPWSETQLSYKTLSRILADDDHALRDWQKYTALNLLPLSTQGTLEWRHMAGTYNVARILQWCRMIGRMYSYTRQFTFVEASEMFMNLNTNSQYMGVLRQVFREESLLLETEGYEERLEDGVLNMKFSLADNTKEPSVKISRCTLAEQVAMMRQRYAPDELNIPALRPGARNFFDDIAARERETETGSTF